LVVLGLLLCAAIGTAFGTALGRLTAPATRAPATHAPAPSGRPITAGVPGVGARGTVLGIPVGYAHTREGAAQAAGNYLAALGGRLALDPTADRAALDQVADPSARADLEKGLAGSLQVDEGLWGIQTAARHGTRVVLTQTPMAYKVASYTPGRASVAVWLVTNVGVDNRQRLTAFFVNAGATLAWLNGDWRLRSIDAGRPSDDVVPACLQNPTPTGGVPAKLDGFVPYGS
jgi:hypothetical protein